MTNPVHENPVLGEEVVIFYLGRPLSHAGKTEHSCRGEILKITKTYLFVSSLGAPVKVRRDGTGFTAAHRLPEAKALHRANFGGPDEWRTPEFIADIIERL